LFSQHQYLVLTLGEAKHITHTESKTLNPEWNEQCELPVTGVQSLLLDVCAWDKDRFGKDYLGEFDLALEEIFADEKTEQPPRWYPLKSKRPGKKTSIVSGEVLLQFTLLDASNIHATDAQIFEKFAALVKSGPGADVSRNPTPSRTPVLAPAAKGKTPSPAPPLGERRTTDDNDDEDDYDVYEDETPEDEDPTKPETAEKRRRRLRIRGLKRKKRENPYEFINGGSDVVGLIFLEIGNITDLPPESNLTKTSFDMDPFVVASLGKKTYRTKTIRHNLNPVFNEKMIFQVLGHEQAYSFSFTVIDRDKYSGNDFIASVNFPVKDLIEKSPKADPDTGLYNLKEVPEFSAPVQRPRFMRLGLSRTSSTQSLSKLTRPGLSKNPSVATTASPVPTPAVSPGAQPQADGFPEGAQPAVPNTGFLQPGDNAVAAAAATLGETSPPDGDDPDFISYTLPLKMKNLEKWEDKHNPQLFIRAKYMPYPALRQQFWRAMLKQYDTDESGLISKVELTTMLDTLGSTLRESTIDSFFQRFPHKASDNDDAEDLTMDEAVICLEDQLQAKSRPQGVAERVKNMLPDADKVKNLFVPSASGAATPAESIETPSESQTTESSTIAIPELSTPGEEGDLLDKDDLNVSTSEEHVVEIRECPICHQPRLNKRKDADIITHIATCASQDWRQVNNLMMGGFVTSSQAQRKWYSKVITKISYGGYKLGANSANILVQDRLTGQINEEKMSVYVRLGIRLLYKGLKSNSMEKKRSKCILTFVSGCLTNTHSPQTPQEPQHQAGQEVRRPGVQGRDPQIHRLPRARPLRGAPPAQRIQELQRVFLPRAQAQRAALLGTAQPAHHRVARRLPVRRLQPHRYGDAGLDQGPRVQRQAAAGRRVPGGRGAVRERRRAGHLPPRAAGLPPLPHPRRRRHAPAQDHRRRVLHGQPHGHPLRARRVRRERASHCAHRLARVWAGHGDLCWRHDGGEHRDHAQRGRGSEAGRGAGVLQVWREHAGAAV